MKKALIAAIAAAAALGAAGQSLAQPAPTTSGATRASATGKPNACAPS